MPKLSLLTPKKLLKILLKEGFEIDHITGSHYVLYNPVFRKRAVIPFHCKDLSKGIIHSILKSSGFDTKNPQQQKDN